VARSRRQPRQSTPSASTAPPKTCRQAHRTRADRNGSLGLTLHATALVVGHDAATVIRDHLSQLRTDNPSCSPGAQKGTVVDSTFKLRPYTGADIFRHIGDGAHRADVTAVALTNPGWAAALAANPTCTAAEREAIAKKQPSELALAYIIADKDASETALNAALQAADVSSTILWAVALWTNPHRMAEIVATLLSRNGQISYQLASVAADRAVDAGVAIDTATLRTLIDAARLAPSLRLAANYADQLNLDELITLVEAYHDQMAVPARNGDVELLLHRRPDVYTELWARAHSYGDTARSALAMQTLTHTRTVSEQQLLDVLNWTEQADSDHAAKLIWSLTTSPRVPAPVVQDLTRRLELRHRSAWQKARTEIPSLTNSAHVVASNDRTLVLNQPATVTAQSEFDSWAACAGDRRPGQCEALLDNPLLPDLLRRRCQNNLASYRKADGYTLVQLAHEAGMPYGFRVRLGLGHPRYSTSPRQLSAPMKLTLNHLLAQVRGYDAGCSKHQAACTGFAAAMTAAHGANIDAWQAAVALIDVLEGRTSVKDLIKLAGAV
jgi:hypothetical protein